MFQSTHIQQLPDWPNFYWEWPDVSILLAFVKFRQGYLLGRAEFLDLASRQRLTAYTLVSSVVSSASVPDRRHGRNFLDPEHVRSSVARQLGLDYEPAPNPGETSPPELEAEGAASVVVDATQNCFEPLTVDRLLGWHRALFPAELYDADRFAVGQWRTSAEEPNRRGRVLYGAPPAQMIEAEMESFLAWFNGPDETDLVIKAAVAHLWLACIRPFDDGNGRIARAITDMALARSDGTEYRPYGMSEQILNEEVNYDAVLRSTRRGTLDITNWMKWFLECLLKSLEFSEEGLEPGLRKVRFWQSHQRSSFNERQRTALKLLLDEPEAIVTAAGWERQAGCSRDTALRDINDLIGRGILVRNPGEGRLTSYGLAGIWN